MDFGVVIIIIAEMAGFNLAGKAQMARNVMLPHEDNIPNKFTILKERHRTGCLVGLKTHPTIVVNVVCDAAWRVATQFDAC